MVTIQYYFQPSLAKVLDYAIRFFECCLRRQNIIPSVNLSVLRTESIPCDFVVHFGRRVFKYTVKRAKKPVFKNLYFTMYCEKYSI